MLFQFTPIEIILGIVTGTLFLIQMLYGMIVYARPARHARKQEMAYDLSKLPPVSVVVYARNESVNLRDHLPALLNQDYPNYEVIVVNDGSTDESDDVLKHFELENKHLYHTFIPSDTRYLSRKKLALTVGIKAAKHDILLFTDADCMPESNHWIASMVSRYLPDTEIVLGYSAYGPYKGFMHRFIAYDNLISGLQYLSSALTRRPYTGSGRNLSYKKSLFFKNKGYSKSLNLHAGADDLFINESSNKRNTEVSYSADSITRMSRIEYFKVWKEMKASRATTQRHYRGGRVFLFRMEEFTFLLFMIAAGLSIYAGIVGNWLLAVLAGLLYLIRLVTKSIILRKSARVLQQPFSLWASPLFEIIQPVFSGYIRIYRMLRGKNDYTFRLKK